MTPVEVRRYGARGPQLALLHGGPGAPGSLAPLARALGGSFRVLEPLQRRHGSVPLSVGQHVADLAAVLPEPMHLLGHSWGAMLGLSFAAAHPERVSSLCLVGCGTYDPASRVAYQRTVDARLGDSGRARLDEIARELAAARDSVTRDRWLAERGRLSAALLAVDLLDPGGADDSLEVDAAGHAETWADVLRLQREGREPAAFAAIRAPVRMLHGDDDPHPGPATRDLLRRFIPELSYVGFPRCGHEPWRERHAREPFLRALEAWIRDPSGKASA